MYKLKMNQNGLTLVELLATVVILSIVTVIISSILFNGLNLSTDAKNSANLHQEANYLLTVLKESHELGEPYYIESNAIQTEIYITQEGSKKTIGNGKFTYKINKIIGDNPATDFTQANLSNKIEIIPSIENFEVTIEIALKDNPSKSYKVSTILSRL